MIIFQKPTQIQSLPVALTETGKTPPTKPSFKDRFIKTSLKPDQALAQVTKQTSGPMAPHGSVKDLDALISMLPASKKDVFV